MIEKYSMEQISEILKHPSYLQWKESNKRKDEIQMKYLESRKPGKTQPQGHNG